ncbi:MAG: hypothetical protein FJ276_07840 [Planctomycetes bacterium]|nr:hypothetical protein [Planctomycetota bacterium]
MADTTPPVETKPSRKSLAGRLLIAAFMGIVILAECLFAYLWLPSESEVTARAERIVKEAQKTVEAANQEKSEIGADAVVEVDLGKFTITNHRLPNKSTFRTDFHLFGVIAKADQPGFTECFTRNERRFRDQVIVEIRNSEITDLEDATLGLIKRRFLEKSNALFGKPMLRSIIFADYTFVEM